MKIAGNSGLDYKPAFAMTKDKTTLQSILEKGLSQISTNDRALLTDKWIALPGEIKQNSNSFLSILSNNLSIITLYVLFIVGILAVILMLLRRDAWSWRSRHLHKAHDISDLKAEFSELENESDVLSHELLEVKAEEEKLKQKIKSLSE